ncbi:MAG: type I CRISPR-associated protein Cas8a1/Csx8 [Oscillospiraceae bacterium]|nr:type I CRISPR-associated protein Cas8a1/Csx8 [Oscillospiraceae bacterium]
MKIKIDYRGYDALLQPTDWRYASATLGLLKFLKYYGFDYEILNNCDEKPCGAVYGFDGILYKQEYITEENYLLFAEHHFSKDMTHISILNMLKKEELSDEDVKTVNELLKSKTVLKKVMGKVKFDGANKDEITSLIEKNRLEIIKSIFRYGKNLYSNYCNSNLLLTGENNHCRLTGYSVDEGRKTRFLGFCFSKDSFDSNDIPEFDFIPFAFSNGDMYETYFINNNYSVETLEITSEILSEELGKVEKRDSRTKLLAVLQRVENFINYDVEIIVKSRDNEYYNSLYVRLECLKKLKDLNDNSLNYTIKITNEYEISVECEVYDRCLNNVLLDDLIERMLVHYFEKDVNKSIVKQITENLITINASWKGNLEMKKIANDLGYKANMILLDKDKSKVGIFKRKLTSAFIAHDYDRVMDIMLKLSEYAEMDLSFFVNFFEEPEKNRELMYEFICKLEVPSEDKSNK